MYKRNFSIIKEYIDNLEEIDSEKCWLLLDNEDETKYCLLKENNKYILKRKIKENDNFDDKALKNLNLNSKIFSNEEKEKIIITNSMFKSHNWIETIAYTVSSFESDNFRKNMFFQLVINSKKKNFRLDFVFGNLISMSTETHMVPLNGITFKIKDIPFNLYFVNDYFVIENLNKLDFEDFDQYSRTVLTCFGLLTGYVPRKEGYYFSYTNNNFENTKEYAYTSDFVDTYDVSYKPINNNLLYSFMPKNISEAERNQFEEKAEENLFLISNSVFSNLCNLNLDNKRIARATTLIMEANQTSLEAQGIVYSVVLETLTSYVADKNKDKLTPIADNEKAKQLQEELHNISKAYISDYETLPIYTYIENITLPTNMDKVKAKGLQKQLHAIAKEYMPSYKDSPIYKKINSINSPTNMDKLLKPFEFLNIPFTDIDKKIINNRNDFLHGNDFIEGEELLEFFSNHFYINCKLNFLVYALLLKIVGHHGKIVNRVKVYLENDESVKDEEFYRDIGDKL